MFSIGCVDYVSMRCSPPTIHLETIEIPSTPALALTESIHVVIVTVLMSVIFIHKGVNCVEIGLLIYVSNLRLLSPTHFWRPFVPSSQLLALTDQSCSKCQLY